MAEFRDLLRFYRKRAGLSQAELGEAVGMSQRSVSNWETGRAVPRPGLIPVIARVLMAPEDELLLAAIYGRTVAEARRIAESDRLFYDPGHPLGRLRREVEGLDEEDIRILIEVARALRRERASREQAAPREPAAAGHDPAPDRASRQSAGYH